MGGWRGPTRCPRPSALPPLPPALHQGGKEVLPKLMGYKKQPLSDAVAQLAGM